MFEKYVIINENCVDIYAYSPPTNGTIQHGDEYIQYSDDI